MEKPQEISALCQQWQERAQKHEGTVRLDYQRYAYLLRQSNSVAETHSLFSDYLSVAVVAAGMTDVRIACLRDVLADMSKVLDYA